MLEFTVFDTYRVLRPGGLFWLDHFFCVGDQLNNTYVPMFGRIGFNKLRWNADRKLDRGIQMGEWYLSTLLEKPMTWKKKCMLLFLAPFSFLLFFHITFTPDYFVQVLLFSINLHSKSCRLALLIKKSNEWNNLSSSQVPTKDFEACTKLESDSVAIDFHSDSTRWAQPFWSRKAITASLIARFGTSWCSSRGSLVVGSNGPTCINGQF